MNRDRLRIGEIDCEQKEITLPRDAVKLRLRSLAVSSGILRPKINHPNEARAYQLARHGTGDRT